MFENIFTPSPLVWTGLIAGLFALPILIHLINMMRHRRVKWAAMEFLLKSHKKHKNYVWLKQLLLLLARITAMLLALFTLGQIGCNNDSLSRFLGSKTTHHYVLLDDSFSMDDISGQRTAFDRAREVLTLIAARARDQQNQRFTLIRFSQAESGGDLANSNVDDGVLNEQVAILADINGQLVDSEFANLIEDVRSKLGATQLSTGPKPALQTVRQLIETRADENSWVYVVSDFREKDWGNQPELQKELDSLSEQTVAIEMIQCAKDESTNLAITNLEAQGNVRVAGVPLMMSVSVQNLSSTTAKKVQIDVESFAYSTADRTGESAEPEPLPTVFIEEIKPGQTETRNFPVFFPVAGQQVVKVGLEKDSISTDNQRWSVVDIKTAANVLIIDNETGSNSRSLATAISPSGLTGISTELRPKEFLRDSSLEALGSFDVIYLLDIDRLDEIAVKNLESFVDAGGGLCCFVGPFTNLSFYNSSMYREGGGVFPVPLEKAIPIPEQFEDPIPDVIPNQHPFFQPVLGMKNSPLDLVQVKQIIRPPLEWKPQEGSTLEVAATVRGEKNWPLIVAKTFGKGRVACVLTTAAPQWNNWSRNATFPLTMLIMEDWLARGQHALNERMVGDAVVLQVDGEKYKSSVRVFTPGADPSNRIEIEKTAVRAATGNDLQVAIGGQTPKTREEVMNSGIYEAFFTDNENQVETNRFALNVDTNESDVALMTVPKLSAEFTDASPKISRWDQFSSEIQRNTASSLTKILLICLILILIGEQILAYSASFHPKRIVARV